jgi:hypothetical protein
MTAAELALSVWLGEAIPFGAEASQPDFAWGGRGRVRPVPELAVEAAFTQGPSGTECVVDGLAFVGQPIENVVLAPTLGLGARWEGTPELLLQAGFAIDMVLFPTLDLRADTRLNWSLSEGLGLVLSVGPQIHTLRSFDKDGDGISDRLDRCDTQPEDPDGFLDADGCPELDNDNDGVPDTEDACIANPEDRDGFLDTDGCPEPDNDGDGLVDDRDACINAAEDIDGNADLDGCPDPDNDGDGVPDVADACPNVAEDIDGFDDEDGCPDPDNDGDGVGDVFDQAPNEAENFNFFQDDDGQPETLPPLLQKVLGAQPRIRFAGNELSDAGEDRAELLAAALLQWPTLRVRLLVVGDDVEQAGKRAISLAAVLVGMGVEADRVAPDGREPTEAQPSGVYVELFP